MTVTGMSHIASGMDGMTYGSRSLIDVFLSASLYVSKRGAY